MKQLSSRHEIDLISPATGRERSVAAELAPYCRNMFFVDRGLDSPPDGKRRRLPRLLRRVGLLGMGIPPEVSGFHFPEMKRELDKLLLTHSYDVVQVELARMALNFPRGFFKRKNVRKILVDYDLTFIPHLRRFQCETRAVPRFFRWLDYRMHRSFALKTWPLFDNLVVMSEVDREKARQYDPSLSVKVVPNGVDTEFYTPQPYRGSGECNLLFLGGAVHYANIDALSFYLRDIYPVVKGEIPNLSLTVIGDGWDGVRDRLPQHPSVSFAGFVEDLRPYASTAVALVAPLRIGGGTRLKILEAMALGLPVVTSQVGSEGIPVKDGEHALIAHTAADHLRWIRQLISDSSLRDTVSRSARRLVEREFSWQSLAEKMDCIYGQ